MMLLHVDQSRALDYLSEVMDQVTTFGDILQLIIVELIYKVIYIISLYRSEISFLYCFLHVGSLYFDILKIFTLYFKLFIGLSRKPIRTGTLHPLRL